MKPLLHLLSLFVCLLVNGTTCTLKSILLYMWYESVGIGRESEEGSQEGSEKK